LVNEIESKIKATLKIARMLKSLSITIGLSLTDPKNPIIGITNTKFRTLDPIMLPTTI
tara:strand:- start:18 stop:191 length:174 start_codon:yes stop_codon:yes gene_type:complete